MDKKYCLQTKAFILLAYNRETEFYSTQGSVL